MTKNELIEELYAMIHRDDEDYMKPASVFEALTKAYEAGQVEMGKWVLYENTGGRAGIQNKIEDIAATLKAKTDNPTEQ